MHSKGDQIFKPQNPETEVLEIVLEIIEGQINGLTEWLVGILFVLVGALWGLLGKIAFFPVLNQTPFKPQLFTSPP